MSRWKGSYNVRRAGSQVSRGQRSGGSDVKVIAMSAEVIERKLEMGQASRLDPSDREVSECPFVGALEPVEKEVWMLHLRGIPGTQIAHLMGFYGKSSSFGKAKVSMMLEQIRGHLRFLHRFWEMALANPKLLSRFKNQFDADDKHMYGSKDVDDE